MQLTREDLRAFLTKDHNTVVSIYISTEPKVYQSERNSLRLRSALDDATKQLERTGLGRVDICSLISPLRDLLDDERFWLHQAQGLALFCSESGLETVRMSVAPSESVRVAHAPYVVPLLEGLEDGDRHALLAVSRNSVRLFSCTRDGIEEIDTTDLRMPRSLSESMRYDDVQKPESSNNTMTGPGRAASGTASSGRGDRRHGFHGHGESEVQEKTYVAAYLHQIDAALLTRLYDLGSPPLIVAAVDYVSAIYRRVSKYRALTSATVEGSPDELRPEELHERARPILEARWRAKVSDARSRFLERAAHGLATSKLSEVVDAADAGRVDTLLVKKGASIWGHFDASTRELTLADATGNWESNDLMDLAARRTLANHGTVLMLDSDAMTDDSAAAILRY